MVEGEYAYAEFFFFKQKTAYEWRISDWSSDVCSSDLTGNVRILVGNFSLGVKHQHNNIARLYGLQRLDDREFFYRLKDLAPATQAGRIDKGIRHAIDRKSVV